MDSGDVGADGDDRRHCVACAIARRRIPGCLRCPALPSPMAVSAFSITRAAYCGVPAEENICSTTSCMGRRFWRRCCSAHAACWGCWQACCGENHETASTKVSRGIIRDISTLAQQAYWDEATRKTCWSESSRSQKLRFFTAKEAPLIEAIFEHILPQSDRIRTVSEFPLCPPWMIACTTIESTAIATKACRPIRRRIDWACRPSRKSHEAERRARLSRIDPAGAGQAAEDDSRRQA